MSTEPTSEAAAFHAILGRALIEPEYRARLMDAGSQEEALNEMLAAMSAGKRSEVLAELKNSIEAIQGFSGAFGPDIRAAT